MRLLKMRAWDKEYDCFITDFSIHADGETIWLGDSETGNPERFIIEQFTGLCDKNGKEIYEGDIIVFDNEVKSIVKFNNGAFGCDDQYLKIFLPLCINNSCEGNDPEYFDTSIYSEIIGNIHQNPELIRE